MAESERVREQLATERGAYGMIDRTETTTSELLETAFASISKAVDDLRAERDLYRNGLQLIARDGETDEGAKIIALLFLGRVVVTSELPA